MGIRARRVRAERGQGPPTSGEGQGGARRCSLTSLPGHWVPGWPPRGCHCPTDCRSPRPCSGRSPARNPASLGCSPAPPSPRQPARAGASRLQETATGSETGGRRLNRRMRKGGREAGSRDAHGVAAGAPAPETHTRMRGPGQSGVTHTRGSGWGRRHRHSWPGAQLRDALRHQRPRGAAGPGGEAGPAQQLPKLGDTCSRRSALLFTPPATSRGRPHQDAHATEASPAEGPDGRWGGGAPPRGTAGSVQTQREDTAQRQTRSERSHRRGHREHVWHWRLALQGSPSNRRRVKVAFATPEGAPACLLLSGPSAGTWVLTGQRPGHVLQTQPWQVTGRSSSAPSGPERGKLTP